MGENGVAFNANATKASGILTEMWNEMWETIAEMYREGYL